MLKKSRTARTITLIVIAVVLVFAQVKFKIFTLIKEKLSGKKTEQPAKTTPPKEDETKEQKDKEDKGGKDKPQEEEQEPVAVKVMKAQKSDFQDLLPVLGTVEGLSEIDLKFELPGVLEFFNFKEGDHVKKGDVIARQDNKDALLKVKYRKAKLDVAQTAVDQTKKKLEIYQNLYDIGAIIKSKLEETQLEVDNKQKEYDAAKIEVASSKQELSKTYMKSPIDGVLGTRDADPGEYVTSNSEVVSVIDTTEVYAKVGIVERDINKVQKDQAGKFFLDTYPNKSFDGIVDIVTPMIKGKSRTLTVKVKVSNPENLLVPGMFTRGTITVFSKKDTYVVPIKAVETSGEESFVFVVDEKNIAHQRPIKTGYITIDEVQIDEGIAEGDLVVTDTPIKLKEGAPVKITEKEEASGEAPVGVGAEIGEEKKES